MSAEGAGIAGGIVVLSGIFAAPALMLGVGSVVWMTHRTKKKERGKLDKRCEAEASLRASEHGATVRSLVRWSGPPRSSSTSPSTAAGRRNFGADGDNTQNAVPPFHSRCLARRPPLQSDRQVCVSQDVWSARTASTVCPSSSTSHQNRWTHR